MRTAAVTANTELGAYRLIAADDVAGPAPQPGQFYMLSAAERWGGIEDGRPYLPRAFSYARARSAGNGVTLEFLLEAIGPGTERLASMEPGDELALVGPLGIGFRLESDRRRVLVGGGIGSAPLVCLQEELPEAQVLLGFRSGEHASAAGLFDAPKVATDDGSSGRRALVTELLGEELEREAEAEVLACGPPPMLEVVRAMCAERDLPAQLALESGMACGFGACFGCVVPTRDGYARLCVDGPVLDAACLESAIFPGAGHA
ncbi:MAG: dihydroorotate dehydrogenase electron transfer subunit [Thermoleophilaceae bacterium]